MVTNSNLKIMLRDTIFTAESKKRELKIFIFCFLFACLLNITGILIYKTPWTEIITSIEYVFLIAIFFYLLIILFRILAYLGRKIWRN